MTEKPVLTLKDLSIEFPTAKGVVQAVKALSLDIQKGAACWLYRRKWVRQDHNRSSRYADAGRTRARFWRNNRPWWY